MELKIYDKSNYAVIEPMGDLAVSSSACILHDSVREMIERKINHIIVDMGNVKYINSVCISALIGGFITLKNDGGELKLANINQKVETILSVTKLNLVFNVYKTIDDAVKSFEAVPGT